MMLLVVTLRVVCMCQSTVCIHIYQSDTHSLPVEYGIYICYIHLHKLYIEYARINNLSTTFSAVTVCSDSGVQYIPYTPPVLT